MVFDGYRKSLKPPEVEEPPDTYFHRPLGYLFARLASHTRLTPNGVSVLALCAGLASAYFYLRLEYQGLVLASALLVLYCILDCSDGQLARLRGQSSRHGRVFDGLCDHVVGFATAFGGAYYAAFKTGDPAYWWVGALALLSALVHNATYDYYKNTYIRMTQREYREGDLADEVSAEQEELRRARGSRFTRFLLGAYRVYLAFQGFFVQLHNRGAPSSSEDFHYSEEGARIYAERNRGLMRAWSWFGVSTHVVLIAGFGLADRVEWYILIRVTAINAAYGALCVRQRRATHRSLTRIAALGEKA